MINDIIISSMLESSGVTAWMLSELMVLRLAAKFLPDASSVLRRHTTCISKECLAWGIATDFFACSSICVLMGISYHLQKLPFASERHGFIPDAPYTNNSSTLGFSNEFTVVRVVFRAAI